MVCVHQAILLLWMMLSLSGIPNDLDEELRLITAKQLLITQTAEAFNGRPDMPLMASLAGITPEEAFWRPDANTPTIEQIVRHISWAKSWYCHRGFNTPLVLHDPTVNEDGDCAALPLEFPC